MFCLRQFFKPVLSATVSGFKVLSNLLLKVHVLVFLGGAPFSICHFWLFICHFYIWLSFMVHICKMIISTEVFFFFEFFLNFFFRLLGGVKAKNSPKSKIKIISFRHPKWQKILSVGLHISFTHSERNHTSCDCHLWRTCVKW